MNFMKWKRFDREIYIFGFAKTKLQFHAIDVDFEWFCVNIFFIFFDCFSMAKRLTIISTHDPNKRPEKKLHYLIVSSNPQALN